MPVPVHGCDHEPVVPHHDGEECHRRTVRPLERPLRVTRLREARSAYAIGAGHSGDLLEWGTSHLRSLRLDLRHQNAGNEDVNAAIATPPTHLDALVAQFLQVGGYGDLVLPPGGLWRPSTEPTSPSTTSEPAREGDRPIPTRTRRSTSTAGAPVGCTHQAVGEEGRRRLTRTDPRNVPSAGPRRTR